VTDPTSPPTRDPTHDPTHHRPTTTVQIGTLRLTGGAALLALLAIVGLMVALIVRTRPAFGASCLWVSAALWIAFLVYWSRAARTASAARSTEPAASRALHQNLLNLSLLLLFLRLPGLRTRWLPDPAAWAAVGLALQAGMFALAAWARRHLGRHWSGIIAAKVDHELVRAGPYRVLRHPIYTAMLGMTAGTALVAGRTHALLGLAIMIVAYARKIPLEEANLRATFGDTFDDYRRRSWALVPGIF